MTDAHRKGTSPFSIAARWICVIAWAFFIFFMSAHSGTDLGTGFTAQVKQVLKSILCVFVPDCEDPVSPFCHFCEYAFFAVLLVNALRSHMSLGRACLIAIACASLYGITDEFHQLYVPDRMCDPLDWATDTAGASLGAVCSMAVMKLRHSATKR